MFLAVTVSALLAAAPFKAASAGISVSSLPPERQELYSELVAQQMTVSGVNVITPKQVQSLLGMERQRSLLGCTDTSNCIAEIASALGVDGVVQGEAAKLDSGSFQVSLKVLWSRDGRPLTVFTGRAADEGALLDLMSQGARLMAQDLTEGDWVRLTVSPAQHVITPSSPLIPVGITLLGVGVAGAVIGTVGSLRANTLAGTLMTQQFVSRGAAEAVAREGNGMQLMAVISYSVAGAALISGALLTLLGGPLSSTNVKPVAWLGNDTAGFALVGVLP